MTEALRGFSDALAGVVENAGSSVVRVDARRRLPATGIVWSADGLIVTAHHVVRRDENIEIGLPDGSTVAAEFVGRDPTTDLAVLRADASGLADFTVELVGSATFNDDFVSATATDGSGSTSEFSLAVQVTDNLAPTIDTDSLVVTDLDGDSAESESFGILTTTVPENETIRLDGLFENAAEDDLHTVAIDWGDGSPPTTMSRTWSTMPG